MGMIKKLKQLSKKIIVLMPLFVGCNLSMVMVSCETFLQGMATGMSGLNPMMGGYNPYGVGAGYQVMPGGFVRDTRMDYLLDPNIAIQQVLNEEQQEYQAAKRWRPNLTLEQFRIEKGQALQMTKNSEQTNSSSNVSTHSVNTEKKEPKIQYGYKDCPHCRGTGKCNTCNGTGLQDKGFGVGKIPCGVCKDHDGKCIWCGGSGKRYGAL